MLLHGCGSGIPARVERPWTQAGRDRGPKIPFMVAGSSAGHLIEEEGLKLLNGTGQKGTAAMAHGGAASISVERSGAHTRLDPREKAALHRMEQCPAVQHRFLSPETLPAGRATRRLG
jgi:hypothetical protein